MMSKRVPLLLVALLLFVICWVLFQGAYNLGQSYENNLTQQRFIASIEKRVALDLPKLKIANERFKTVADPISLKIYLKEINSHLSELNSPVMLTGIQQVTLPLATNLPTFQRTLNTIDQVIPLQFQTIESAWSAKLSIVAPILAFLMTLAAILISRHKMLNNKRELDNAQIEKGTPKLVINLKNKSVQFGSEGQAILLSNKPFCFYAALLDYCLKTDKPNLKHNSDIPDELIQTANQFFYRLIALGHTKRKKPDFQANLDKTLSEIRSALDEVFALSLEHKKSFYPPKAQGEGSRSKKHNYAIQNQNPGLIEFIGK